MPNSEMTVREALVESVDVSTRLSDDWKALLPCQDLSTASLNLRVNLNFIDQTMKSSSFKQPVPDSVLR